MGTGFPQLWDITVGWGLQVPWPAVLRVTLLGCARKQSPLSFGLGLAHTSALLEKQRKQVRLLPRRVMKGNSAPAMDILFYYSCPVN